MTPGPTNSAVDIDLNKTVTKKTRPKGPKLCSAKVMVSCCTVNRITVVVAEASEPKASERRGRSSCVDGDLMDFYLKTF